MSKWINKDFMINHYFSMLTDPTPDVSENDKRKARIVLDALKMTKGIGIVFCKECKHSSGEQLKSDGRMWCDAHGWMYFCSDGERGTDE